jgi:hypothetical protein
MDTQREIFKPNWWRFTDYEIHAGCIRPASGAKLESYNPGNAYEQNQTRKDIAPPYQALIDLLHEIELGPPDRISLAALTSKHQEAILQWCCAHGLLGVLPHVAQSAFLAPRFAPSDEYFQTCRPIQRRFERCNGAWTVSPDYLPDHGLPFELAGQLVDDKTRRLFHEPGVNIEDLRSGQPRWELFGSTWARFFPDVPKTESETYNYPLLLGKPFWQQYGEPLAKFLEAARLLRAALTDQQKGHARGRQTLNRLVSPIRISFGKSRSHGLEQRWVSPSLLATYAMMAGLDLKSTWRLHECKRKDCRKIFVSRAYQVSFCSRTCQFTFHKRKWRERQKAEEKEQEAIALRDHKPTKDVRRKRPSG